MPDLASSEPQRGRKTSNGVLPIKRLVDVRSLELCWCNSDIQCLPVPRTYSILTQDELSTPKACQLGGGVPF